jgi:hypothetical protein
MLRGRKDFCQRGGLPGVREGIVGAIECGMKARLAEEIAVMNELPVLPPRVVQAGASEGGLGQSDLCGSEWYSVPVG